MGPLPAHPPALGRPFGNRGKRSCRLLRRILDENAGSAFGTAHGFAGLRDYADYAAAVPARPYEDFASWIERAAEGEPGVLTTEPPVAFERTGGSTSGGKLIPCTVELLDAFRAAVLPWLWTLSKRRPALASGRAFVAVSPCVRGPETTPGGHRIGLPSEAAYLGETLAPAFAAILANGGAAASATTLEDWQILTACDLVRTPDVSLFSVWSPTFLGRLLDVLVEDTDRVMDRLADAPEARSRLAAALYGGKIRTEILWPRLDTISCWADGPSRPFADRLASQFPRAYLEPKGLLATESPITVPMGFTRGNVPALLSAFLEFVEPGGETRLADELREGGEYRVLLTTPGGLYRYDIGDTVRCCGHHGETPLLRFVGRGGLVSDLVGEKLTDGFVSAALSDLPCAAMLVARMGEPPFYELWLDSSEACDGSAIETRLRANPQYALARRLGQLGPPTVLPKPGFVHALHAQRAKEGQRPGDLKAQALLPWVAQAGRHGPPAGAPGYKYGTSEGGAR